MFHILSLQPHLNKDELQERILLESADVYSEGIKRDANLLCFVGVSGGRQGCTANVVSQAFASIVERSHVFLSMRGQLVFKTCSV
jgi:hypothetical protein